MVSFHEHRNESKGASKLIAVLLLHHRVVGSIQRGFRIILESLAVQNLALLCSIVFAEILCMHTEAVWTAKSCEPLQGYVLSNLFMCGEPLTYMCAGEGLGV